MRVLILIDGYPSPENLYSSMFAHVRVKRYLSSLNEVKVIGTFTEGGPDYTFEGVPVCRAESIEQIGQIIDEFRPDVMLVHFATFPIIRLILARPRLKVLVWVHGFEALAWYRRLFNLGGDALHFVRYIKGNLVQLFHFRRLIRASNRSGRIRFIFVSRWMKSVTETDCVASIRHASIIPNPIDDGVFKPVAKTAEDRHRILLIRPFDGRKYATDLVGKAMSLLAKRPVFRDLRFTFIGKGVHQSPLARQFADAENVELRDGFLTQAQISHLHGQHGVFLCPSRQDAQGVSMCEAMSSGLVPISSNNTAIPEFIRDGETGLLVDNRPEQIADAIERLALDPALYLRLSKAAPASIIAKAGIDRVIEQELALIERMGRL